MKMNKFNAKKTWSELCQRTFDSKLEARRGEMLRLEELGGLIKDLQYQHKFVLCDKPKITITIDFCYLEKGTPGKVYEDAKGVLMADFRVKMAWLKEQRGVEVRLWPDKSNPDRD